MKPNDTYERLTRRKEAWVALMAVKIFFCYAHEDEDLLNKLKRHLWPLQRQGLIAVWHDRDISAGSEWEREISQHLNAAQIILLLVSPDFMYSEYCYGVEMKRTLERHDRGEVRANPVVLRHIYWQGILGTLQALPTNAKPVRSWSDIDEALYDVTEGIRKVIKELMAIDEKMNWERSEEINQLSGNETQGQRMMLKYESHIENLDDLIEQVKGTEERAEQAERLLRKKETELATLKKQVNFQELEKEKQARVEAEKQAEQEAILRQETERKVYFYAWITSISLSIILIVVFEILIYLLPGVWFVQHRDKYVLQLTLDALILFIVVGFFHPRLRTWFWGVGAIALLSVIIQLLS